MKKKILLIIILSVFFIAGCSSSKSEEKLLDYYVEAYTKGDYSALKKVFPEVIIENFKKENLEMSVQSLKETYGEGFEISYKIISKGTPDDTDYELFKKMYDSVELSDCSKLDVVFSYSGSKSSKDETFDLFYCKVNGEWYLLI